MHTSGWGLCRWCFSRAVRKSKQGLLHHLPPCSSTTQTHHPRTNKILPLSYLRHSPTTSAKVGAPPSFLSPIHVCLFSSWAPSSFLHIQPLPTLPNMFIAVT